MVFFLFLFCSFPTLLYRNADSVGPVCLVRVVFETFGIALSLCTGAVPLVDTTHCLLVEIT